MIRRRFVLVVPFLLGALPVAAAEAPAPPEARANVSFTLTVGRVGGPTGTKERTYKFVGQDGSVSRMLVGFRTPLPTRSSEEARGDAGSTAYIYQNVGVTADLDARSIDNGRFLVSGQVEISGAREGAPAESTPSGKPPMIGTFQQELHVVVANGKKIRIAEGPDPESGTLYVDLRVDRLE
jgi:hypothetical protein